MERDRGAPRSASSTSCSPRLTQDRAIGVLAIVVTLTIAYTTLQQFGVLP